MNRLLRSIFVLLLVLPAGGCSLLFTSWLGRAAGGDPASDPATDPGGTDPTGGVERYLVTDPQVTLAWDPPPSAVTSYKLYYRHHSEADWTFVATVPAAASPEVTLAHSSFGNGDYEFGVVAVSAAAAESPMHTSLDTTAYPDSGWYLRWEVL